MKLQPFSYVIVLHPLELEKGMAILDPNREENKADQNSQLIGGPDVVMAKDMAQAQVIAATKLDPKYMDKIERVEIVISPF